jgi:hypothetical protein
VNAPDLALVSLVALLASGLTAGAWIASARAELPHRTRRRITLGTSAGLVAWLAFTATLARSEVLSVWGTPPPRVLLLPATVFVSMILLNRIPGFGELVRHIPRWWPVAALSARIAVELVLWALLLHGRIGAQLTFEGRNVDIYVGLSAPVVAYLIASGRIPAPALMIWNAVGLASLVNVAAIAATSLPGPWHQAWPGPALTEIAHWPGVWIPAFILPLAVFLHIVSIRQTTELLTRTPLPISRTS